jgi:hypothetical protein
VRSGYLARNPCSPGFGGCFRRLGGSAMRANPHKQLRSKVAAYLAGRTSLRDFRRWFIPASWDVATWAPADLQQLVYSIEARLMEHENGHLTEEELQDHLRRLTSWYSADEIDYPTRTESILQTIPCVNSSA